MIRTETINGIKTTFEYDNSKAIITILPDEEDIKFSTIKDLVLYFRSMFRWVERVKAKNPGWKIFGVTNGEEL